MKDVLLQISGPGFCAGVVARDGRVIEAAPIVKRRVMGLDGRGLVALCRTKGWGLEKIHAVTSHD